MNTGGPAFPNVPFDPGYSQWDQGMTLLDWYAGQALAGFFGFISETQATMKDAGLPGIKREQVSRECYEQAESMLAEKARREAVVQESSTTDHSPDAGKMAELEAANRELVEALEGCLENLERWCPVKHREARDILSKHKESK